MAAWEGKMPPIVLILLQKLGGRVEITEEDMRQYVDSTYTMRTWYDDARMINMYELVNNATVEGEVVDTTDELGQRSIGPARVRSGRHNGMGELRS